MPSNILAQNLEPTAQIRDRSINELVVSAIPYDRYVFCGEVSLIIEKNLGIKIDAERVRKIAFRDNRVKRMWTQDGWKITRMKTISDYIET